MEIFYLKLQWFKKDTEIVQNQFLNILSLEQTNKKEGFVNFLGSE